MRPKLEQGFIPSSQMCVTDNGPYNNQNCESYYQILVTIINELHSTQMWYQRQPTTVSEPETTSTRLQGLLCLTRIPWKIHAVFAAAFVTSFLAAHAVTTSQIDEEAYLPSLLSNIFTNETE